MALVLLPARLALAEDLIVNIPDKHITVANAIERDASTTAPGEISGSTATFTGLDTDTPYDLAIETTDGQLYCGADMSWCDPTPADPQAEALGDDDRQAISAIVTDILGFANKPRLAMLIGSHDRAVGLVDLPRINGFHSDKGDEVVWREEVWFFKWENGGWERVPDQSRLLRRERFASHVEYEKEMKRLHWVPAIGGVQLTKGAAPLTITIPPPSTTQPGTK